MFRQHVCGSNRPRRKIPAAVRAHALQHGFGTLRAESAFISANPRVPAIRRQVPVTALTIGPKFQHFESPQTLLTTLVWEIGAVERTRNLQTQFPNIFNDINGKKGLTCNPYSSQYDTHVR